LAVKLPLIEKQLKVLENTFLPLVKQTSEQESIPDTAVSVNVFCHLLHCKNQYRIQLFLWMFFVIYCTVSLCGNSVNKLLFAIFFPPTGLIFKSSNVLTINDTLYQVLTYNNTQ